MSRAHLLILQPFRHFTYVTTHSPIVPSLYLRRSSFTNPSVALPTSQLILQPFRCFTYVTVHSPTLFFASPTSQVLYLMSSAHSPTFPFLHLHHNSFSALPSLYLRRSSFSNPSVASPTHSSSSNPSFASPMSQALHLIHLASRP